MNLIDGLRKITEWRDPRPGPHGGGLSLGESVLVEQGPSLLESPRRPLRSADEIRSAGRFREPRLQAVRVDH